MKLNLDFQIKNLDGDAMPSEQANASKVLAGALSSANKGNAIKLHDWALRLWRKEVLEIDKVDKEFLEAFVESTETLTVLAKVPILNAIKEQYEKADKTESGKKK
jgi:hypothetical protein